MSRRALTLPLRISSPSVSSTRTQHLQSWTCHRCLSTQSSTTTTTPPPPEALPSTTQPDDSESAQWRTAQLLATRLKHRIPPQYLQYSTSPFLHKEEIAQREADGLQPHSEITGVVVDAGKMAKTVKVRIVGRRWEKRIGKYFTSHTNHLVHDPNSSLVVGDLISLHRLRVSSAVHHVVAAIVAPFGTPISARPPIPTPDERLAAYKAKRLKKLERRDLRARAAEGDEVALLEMKERGLEVGKGSEQGKQETEAEKLEQGRADRKAKRVAKKAEENQRAARKVEREQRREKREAGEQRENKAHTAVVSETGEVKS